MGVTGRGHGRRGHGRRGDEATGDEATGDEATGAVVIRVTDYEAVVAVLQRRGVRFLAPPAAPAWGGEVRAFVRDPDGHLTEVSSVT